MQNIRKICTILTLVAISSVSSWGCSSTSSQQELSDVSSVLESPVAGKEVTLQGKIIGQMEDCHIFTDGTSKILLHFKDENLSYEPNTTVKISGVVEQGVMPGMHHFEGGHHHDISMDTMIMVKNLQVIAAN